MNQSRTFIVAIFTGILLTLSFPPFPLPLLAWVAFVPLLFALEQNPRKPILLIYLTFFVYQAGANWWVGSWQPKADPFLLASGIILAFVHPFFFMMPVIAYRYIHMKLGRNTALWLFPFIWTAFEWLHSLGDLSYPWLTVGYSQVYNRFWVQFADITGVWGVSFLVVLINVFLLRLLFVMREVKADGKPFSEMFNRPATYRFLIPLIVIVCVPYLYGFIRVSQFDHVQLLESNPKISIALVQPDVNPWEKWSSDAGAQILVHRRLVDSLLRAKGHFDLAVWSETAIPFEDLDMNSRHNFSQIRKWLDYRDISLLTGFSDLYIYKKGENIPVAAKNLFGDTNMKYSAYNAAILLNPESDSSHPEQIYRKMKLTPFSERIPYADVFYFALSWFEWGVGISSWEFGTEQKTLELVNDEKKARIGNIICIESVYPGFVRNFSAEGAQVYTLITNDAWFDHTPGPEQHYAIAQMRAIESKRYIARCANSGVTGFIMPTGRTLLRAPQYKRMAISATVPLLNDKTFYVQTGDWIAVFSTALSVVAVIMAKFYRSRRALAVDSFKTADSREE